MYKKRVRKNSSGVHASSTKPTKSVKMKEINRKKQCVHKNVIHGRKPFIIPIPKTGKTDLHQLQVNNYGYNEGTICLVNE